MNTKICKYCKESILEEATKCPKCQSFQSPYKSLNFISLVTILSIIPIMLFFPQFLSKIDERHNFKDYQDKINLQVLSKDTLKREDCKGCDLLNILVEVNNETAIDWEHGEYEVEFRSATGELVNIEKRSDYQLTLTPNTTAKSSIKVPIYPEYTNSEVTVKLVKLRQVWQ